MIFILSLFSKNVVLVPNAISPSNAVAQSSNHFVTVTNAAGNSDRHSGGGAFAAQRWADWTSDSHHRSCFAHIFDAWAGVSQRLISAGTADQVPPRGPSCLGLHTGCWLGSGGWAFQESQTEGLEVAYRPFCLTLLVGEVMALARLKGRRQRPLVSTGGVVKKLGPCWYNHRKCPLNLRFCPQTIVTLKEGVPTQDPWICVLSPSCALLNDQNYPSISFREVTWINLGKGSCFSSISGELFYGSVILRFRNVSSLRWFISISYLWRILITY